MNKYFLFLFLILPELIHAQIISSNGNLMGEFINYEQNLMPIEDSEAFVVPDSLQLKQWKRMMTHFLSESYSEAEDSLSSNFTNYEMVLLTDTSFVNRTYYLIREKTPLVYGWGLFVSDPDYQRDAIVAVPHPLFDSYTPQEGVNLFQYLGARVLTMAGTHRCANDEEAFSDGTTSVCSESKTSEKFKVSDMAHYDSSAFQIAHEAIKELSTNVYAISVHGHADSDCEDVFLSNGRSDDPQASLQTLRDNLIAKGVDAAMTGDGSSCTLAGTTNVQGRYLNGSNNPADDQPISNTGYFFHMEQGQDIRRSFDGHKKVIDAFADLIPRVFSTFTIPEYPSLIFNEIHFNPASDANNNGSVGSVSDEFLEIINTGTKAINLDNWIIADYSSDRHVVPATTNLLPNQALLVFGQNSFEGSFGGATVQAASTNALSLSNSGENIYIKSPANDIITMLDYPGDVSGESITLNPDITGTTYIAHSTADVDDGSFFSPGTKINGDPFLPFIEISGDAGWRMMAVPTQKMPISDLNNFTPVQGFGDGFTRNLYSGWNGTEWEYPGSINDSLQNGEGFIFYFYDNDNAESSTLPITLRGTGTVPSSDVEVDLHTNGDKWNLVGNPFDKPINFGSISVSGGALESLVGQVYDPTIDNYVVTTSLGDSISSWQGIMIQNASASSVTFPISSIINEASFLKEAPKDRAYIVFSLTNSDQTIGDEMVLFFSNNSTFDWDSNDATQLPSLSNSSVQFSAISNRNDTETVQTQFSLPLDFGSSFEIPVRITRNNIGSQLTLRVKKMLNIPENTSFELVSNDGLIHENLLPDKALNITVADAITNTYSILVQASSSVGVEHDRDQPNEFIVSQNYPNPFNPETTIQYSIPKSSTVSIQIFNIQGALISDFIDSKPAGIHSYKFDGSGLSSGIYFYKISTSLGFRTGRMVLLK
tara:strand:- start:66461 stop:69268 length:2808 start_codon:yes stop_codon:yes gene_type:complete